MLPDPNTAQSIGWLVLTLSALIAAANQIDSWFKRRTGKDAERVISPSPLTVQAAAEFVQKRDFDAHVAANAEAHDGIFRKIGGVERGIGEKLERIRTDMHDMELRLGQVGEGRAEKTHNRVNEVLAAVSNLEGRVEELAKHKDK